MFPKAIALEEAFICYVSLCYVIPVALVEVTFALKNELQ